MVEAESPGASGPQERRKRLAEIAVEMPFR